MRTKTCKVDGCNEPVVRGGLLCASHIGEKRRCEGIVRTFDPKTGEVLSERQCKKSARLGLTVCAQHGGSGPKMSEVSHRTAALTAMQRFVQPYQGALDPISAYEMEYRRTYGRIQWLEEQIAGLEDERDLIYGLTKEEHITASEFTGTNRTYEARIHVYEDMLRWERKHFLELTKLWIRAGLEERKLSIIREYIDFTYSKVQEVASALGHDPRDPAVREVIMRLFKRDLPDQPPAIG